MKRKLKPLGICCLILCLLLQCTVFQTSLVYGAGSASISFSSSTVKVGDTLTVTVTFSGGGTAMGSVEASLTYNTELMTFVSGDNANEATKGEVLLVAVTSSTSGVSSFSFKLTFKAQKAGTAAFKVNATEFITLKDDVNLAPVSANKSLTVRTISSDANLKALTVSTGTLSPKFAAGTTSYTVNVANNVSSVTVAATAADANATVTGTGKYNLTAGKSTTVNVVVKAENGTTTKTYKITVTRAAATPAPTKSPTKAPTPTPARTPTPSSATATPTNTPEETETPVGTETPENPSETTPDDGSAGPTTTMDETGSVNTPTGGVTSALSSPTPDSATQKTAAYSGFFTVRAAFIFCAVGMFLVGGAVGFILCYVLQSKKRK